MDNLESLPVDNDSPSLPHEQQIIDQYMDPYTDTAEHAHFAVYAKLIIVIAVLAFLTNNPTIRGVIGRVIGPSHPAIYRSYISAGVMVVSTGVLFYLLDSYDMLL